MIFKNWQQTRFGLLTSDPGSSDATQSCIDETWPASKGQAAGRLSSRHTVGSQHWGLVQAFRIRRAGIAGTVCTLCDKRVSSVAPPSESRLVPVPLSQASGFFQKLFSLSKPQIPHLQIKLEILIPWGYVGIDELMLPIRVALGPHFTLQTLPETFSIPPLLSQVSPFPQNSGSASFNWLTI